MSHSLLIFLTAYLISQSIWANLINLSEPINKDQKVIHLRPEDAKRLETALKGQQILLDEKRKVFIKNLPHFALLIPLKLQEAGLAHIGPYSLEEIITDFKKLSYVTDENFVTFSAENNIHRAGSVCDSSYQTIIVNLPSFENLGYNSLRSAQFLLHEAFCAFPSLANPKLRKYDDTNYEISARMIVLLNLLQEHKIELFKKLSEDPLFIQFAGGGISGGPGGGNIEAQQFKAKLILLFEDLRDQCSQQRRKSISVHSMKGQALEISCEWLYFGRIREAFYQLMAEGPRFTEEPTNSSAWVNLNLPIIYQPRALSSYPIKAQIYFSVGLITPFIPNNSFLTTQALFDIFHPCVQVDSAVQCFFDPQFLDKGPSSNEE